jgi:hypothetical protein
MRRIAKRGYGGRDVTQSDSGPSARPGRGQAWGNGRLVWISSPPRTKITIDITWPDIKVDSMEQMVDWVLGTATEKGPESNEP